MPDPVRSEDAPLRAGHDSLPQLALLFLRLGATAFGGPAGHIAIMEDEFVRRRRWLSRETFLDLLSASNLIPGPNSTEMAIHVGFVRAGIPGLLLAGVCFILPAAILVTAMAWAYVRFGQLPAAVALLYGVKPVVIAIIAQALWRLGRTAVKSALLVAMGALCLALGFLGVNELLILAGAGVAGAGWVVTRSGSRRSLGVFLPIWRGLPVKIPALLAVGAATATAGLWPLFLVFVKIGSVIFGSGYVLLAFLRADLVVARGWITDAQLVDAIAIGQVTPGPVFTAATFIGYLLRGPAGAVVATVAIFLPAFVLVALSGPLVPRIRKSAVAAGFLDGVNVASLALMAVVGTQLARATLVDAWTVLLAAASAVLLFRFRVNSVWLVLAGALVGAAAYWLRAA